MQAVRVRLKPLCEQVIVLTGASSGIGLATARMASRAGAAVFLISRNAAALARICETLNRRGGRTAYAVADVGDSALLAAAARAAVERFGRIDTWANAAGVGIYARLLDTPTAEHERLFRTNYWGVVNACSIAMPYLREHGGAFVTVGSVVSNFGTPLLGAYAASKHAVKGFLDSLRVELIADRAPVSVTLIKPSGIATPFAEHAATMLPYAAKIPPPAYAPEDVARAILFAAERPRREITVGAAGTIQMAGAALLPLIADRISVGFMPWLVDRKRAASRHHNLFEPGQDGTERSLHERSFRGRLYTDRSLRLGAAAGVLLGSAALAMLAARRARRSSRAALPR